VRALTKTAYRHRGDNPLTDSRLLASQALSRAAGAPLVAGNDVTLLKDGKENYDAWLDAIANAKSSILFESYIIHEDEVGDQFAEALIDRVREGVKVYLLYDWLGGYQKTSFRYWRRLRRAGVEVRCFNRFQFTDPLGSITRDHRKTIVVDGKRGFVTGLCIGKLWLGDPARGIDPWRDTGIEMRGPAVSDLTYAFARVWETAGEPLPQSELVKREDIPPAGDMDLRVVATEPETSGVYRLDQLIAAAAKSRLWLTDAYYAGTAAYVQALVAAARDGVDVRLLVPGGSDIPVVRGVSRMGYRPLLEGGVRVFEWNGSMIHAKSAVADGTWARVGSTNLNLASWLTNWELDVAIENTSFAGEMEEMYAEDLANSTEIVLNSWRHVRSSAKPATRHRRGRRPGSAGRVVAGALSIGKAVDAAISRQRELGAADAQPLAFMAILMIVLAWVGYRWPRGIAYPVAIMLAWLAIGLLLRAWRLLRSSSAPSTEFEVKGASPRRTEAGVGALKEQTRDEH